MAFTAFVHLMHSEKHLTNSLFEHQVVQLFLFFLFCYSILLSFGIQLLHASGHKLGLGPNQRCYSHLLLQQILLWLKRRSLAPLEYGRRKMRRLKQTSQHHKDLIQFYSFKLSPPSLPPPPPPTRFIYKLLSDIGFM